MKTHYVKCEIEFFQKVVNGEKPWELRLNDRNYEKGDVLIQQEFDKEMKQYTGREHVNKIGFVLTDAEKFGLMKNYCIMTLC